MLGLSLGLLYANAGEWIIHKYVLHGLGKKKDSFWHFHWGEHHHHSRRMGFRDPDYERSAFGWHAQGKETLAVSLTMLAHAPLWPVAPWFTLGVWYSGLNYLHKHKKSHLDPEWARQRLTSHYDHHMGKNQDANWCVTRPWFDWVMGTRVHYAFTEAERADQARKQRRGATAAQPSEQAHEAGTGAGGERDAA